MANEFKRGIAVGATFDHSPYLSTRLTKKEFEDYICGKMPHKDLVNKYHQQQEDVKITLYEDSGGD